MRPRRSGRPIAAKYPGSAAAYLKIESLTFGQRRMLDHAHQVIGAPTLAWSDTHETRSLHARQRTHAPDEVFKEGSLLHRLLVARCGECDVHGKHVV